MNETRTRDSPGRKELVAAKLDAEIARLVHVGYIACGVFAAVMLTTLGWMLLAPRCGLHRNVVEHIGWGLSAAGMACLLVTLRVAGRPVQKRTKYDPTMMFFVVWFFAIFGITAPTFCIGSAVCLVVSIKRFKGTLGEAVITFGERGEGGTKFYPRVTMKQRETYPLALAYLALALLWPAIVFLLYKPWVLPL